MHDSMRAAVAAQRAHGHEHGIPWGFSESQFIVPGEPDLGYGPCGMPGLALKPLDTRTLVVAPYASWLALLVDSRHALQNLRALEVAGASGAFGFYEALDYSRGTVELADSWMAHHQGMSLLAAAELLCGAPLQKAFHAEPQVRATERLLEERVPRTIVPDKAEAPCVVWPEESAA
jgi:cyclic beta-1,2-glucan synthetase